MTLSLVAINIILEELKNGVNKSLFADDLAIHITRNKRVATKALQGVTKKLNTSAQGVRTNLLQKQNRKHGI